MIKADGQSVWISPKCYAPDNEIPVTYRYLISENRLELAGRFQEKEDMYLKWSYSEEAMDRRETIYHKLEQRRCPRLSTGAIGRHRESWSWNR